MPSGAFQTQAANWLAENGPAKLGLLFRAIVYPPSVPILVGDDDRDLHLASSKAGKLLGFSRDRTSGRSSDDFIEPDFKPQISGLEKAFPQPDEQDGILRFVGLDGSPREVENIAKRSVLPVRNLLVPRDKTIEPESEGNAEGASGEIPAWAQDYALFLLDVDGKIVAWYAGAERSYGYARAEALHQHVALLYPAEDTLRVRLQDELKRSVAEGHFGNQGWCVRKDGTCFWASIITLAVKYENGELQGHARVVRDFSERHERDRQLRRKREQLWPLPAQTAISGIISGEFDRIVDANDAFLELVGYSREDLRTERLKWPDLTPPEYFASDELAYEEGLEFGGCTPFEKKLTRKDGTRASVLVATAVLNLSPFRWISIVQDLRGCDPRESFEGAVVGVKDGFEEIVGRSAAMKRMLGLAAVVAPTDATVWIEGESGTGKELVARALHRMSSRRDHPFITLNCAAIPAGLLESELFGYERGAFSGALSQQIGRFELAHRGTLFLDEVGDIPLDLQPKLLRALQTRKFQRLGGARTIPIDVRMVAATNRNLKQMMADQLFRSDLYHQLRVFPITTPRLRDRPADIPLLAWHFTNKYALAMNKHIERIPSDTMRRLKSWTWPGNVGELENFIERAVVLSRGPTLRAAVGELRTDPVELTGSGPGQGLAYA